MQSVAKRSSAFFMLWVPVIEHRPVAVSYFIVNYYFPCNKKDRKPCLFIVEAFDYLSLRTRKFTVAVNVSFSCVMIDETVEIPTIQRKAKTL